MKLRGIHITLIVILAVAILMITSSDSVVPYSRDTLFSHMYKYEGMENPPSNLPPPLTTEQFNDAVNEIKKSGSATGGSATGGSMTGGSTTGGSMTGGSMTGGSTTDGSGNSVTDESKKEPKKVEGFALQPAPFGNYQPLDRFGSTPSGPQCFGRSSGYSKSLGPLCLSQEDARLLSTRGGNISGNDSTIGH